MLVLHNMRMVPSNVEKNNGTTECDKSTVTYDVSTAQCKAGTIKCEVTCDVGTAQCEVDTIKCEEKK